MHDQTPEPPVLGSSLTDRHMAVSFVYHAMHRCLRPTGSALGLGIGQPRLLSYLAVNGSCNQRELADYFEIGPAAVCRMLDALERRGLVTQGSAHDRRSKVISITPAGADAVAAWDLACRDVAEAMVEGFTPRERAQLDDLLRRVHENLRRAARDAGEARRG